MPARLLSRRARRGRGRVDPHDQPAGQPHVDPLHVAFEQVVAPFERGQLRPGGVGVLLGQQHLDRIVDAQVPAAVVDPHRGGDPGGQRRFAPEHLDQRGGADGGVIADDQRQAGEAAQIGARDHLPLPVDQLLLAVVLPQRERPALGQPHIQRPRQPPLDRRGSDPGQFFELGFRPPQIDREDRRAAPGRERRHDHRGIGRLAALDLDVFDHHAERSGRRHGPVGRLGKQRVAIRRPAQREPAIGQPGERQQRRPPRGAAHHRHHRTPAAARRRPGGSCLGSLRALDHPVPADMQRRRLPDPADLPFEHDAAAIIHKAAHLFAQSLEIGGGGVAGVDQEIGVLFRNHSAAAGEAAAAGLVDQPPCLVTRRVGEGGPAGARANRLRGLARRPNLLDMTGDRGRLAGFAAEPREDENPVRIDLRVTVGQPHPLDRDRAPDAAAVDHVGRDQHVLELAAIGAGIGPEPAADRAGNAGQEFEAGDAGLGRGQRDVQIERPGPGLDQLRGRLDLGKAAPEPHDDAPDAAVTHQQVRADPDRRDRNIARQRRQKSRQILGVGGAEQHLRRPADAEPGQRPDRRIRRKPPAHRRQPLDQPPPAMLRAVPRRRSSPLSRIAGEVAAGKAAVRVSRPRSRPLTPTLSPVGERAFSRSPRSRDPAPLSSAPARRAARSPSW